MMDQPNPINHLKISQDQHVLFTVFVQRGSIKLMCNICKELEGSLLAMGQSLSKSEADPFNLFFGQCAPGKSLLSRFGV